MIKTAFYMVGSFAALHTLKCAGCFLSGNIVLSKMNGNSDTEILRYYAGFCRKFDTKHGQG